MGTSLSVDGCAPIHTFYASTSWIEGPATEQLRQVASLDGIQAVAAMPDLHPGKYGPVGCALLAKHVHPRFVGSDIGCGMGLFQLDQAVRKLKVERTAERLQVLEGPWDGDVGAWLEAAGVPSSAHDAALGTIGGGNHFCELQAIEEIVDEAAAKDIGLDASNVHALVHSGSRGLGFATLGEELADGGKPRSARSEAGSRYLTAHDHAVQWAAANRSLIAHRASHALRCDSQRLVDLPHNMLEVRKDGILHRKGAAPSDRGLVPVPGSRDTLSYLMAPLEEQGAAALWSLAHGAGRRHDRASMHGRIRTSQADRANLLRNAFGGRLVCTSRDLLVEEAPEAYKNIEGVINDLVSFGLARVVATFRPLVTFKTARQERPDRKALRVRGERREARR